MLTALIYIFVIAPAAFGIVAAPVVISEFERRCEIQPGPACHWYGEPVEVDIDALAAE